MSFRTVSESDRGRRKENLEGVEKRSCQPRPCDAWPTFAARGAGNREEALDCGHLSAYLTHSSGLERLIPHPHLYSGTQRWC
jgi:hypothetical protein